MSGCAETPAAATATTDESRLSAQANAVANAVSLAVCTVPLDDPATVLVGLHDALARAIAVMANGDAAAVEAAKVFGESLPASVAQWRTHLGPALAGQPGLAATVQEVGHG